MIGKVKIVRLATISPCGTYRYLLDRTREYDRIGPGRLVNFVMLNPSTADEKIDDPTIRRCMAFAWGMGANALAVTNLYAIRSPDPKGLTVHPDPVGPENDAAVFSVARDADTVVVAWGAWEPPGFDRGLRVVRKLRSMDVEPVCLGTTKQGMPRHPLYVKGDVTPVPYRHPGE